MYIITLIKGDKATCHPAPSLLSLMTMKATTAIFLFLLLPSLVIPTSAQPVAATPTTVNVLTLDNRPPNFLMLKQIAAIAGIYPSITLGDQLSQTPQPLDCTQFGMLSLNAAVAGSLVGSRTADPRTLLPPVVRHDALIHFAVPRVQPTVTEPAQLEQYSAVIKTLERADVQNKVVGFIKGDTDKTGDTFLDLYANRISGWLDFLSRANLDPDRLLITLDDNRPGPLSDYLKLALGELSHHVMDGTDEGMMLLLARFLREHQPDNPTTVGLIWTSPGDLTAIAPLESGFVMENLLAELDWLHARATSRLDMLEPWRPILWVNGSGIGENSARSSLIQDISQNLGEARVIVADIANMNGADPLLIDAWRKDGPPDGLVGYLGWNTSSNTLGSAVALWAAMDYGYATRSDPTSVQAACEEFLWARLLDDWLYQSIVRQEVRESYVLIGANPWNLTEEQSHGAASEIASRLVELWRDEGIDMSIPLQIIKPLGETSFVVELPWNRFFEINLYPIDVRAWVPQIPSD